jgi:3-(3-hydroxy-phenyl)propionate hydroxylase
VQATYIKENKEYTVKGSILCGADGSNSVVRREVLKTSFEGDTYATKRLGIDVKNFLIKDHFPGGNYGIFFLGKACSVTLMQIDHNLTRIGFKLPPEIDSEKDIQPQFIEKTLLPILPKKVINSFEVVRQVIYRVHQRVAGTFGKGRIFIMGDAAHVNNPLGGLGLNTGIQDAFQVAEAILKLLCDKNPVPSEIYITQRKVYVEQHTLSVTAERHKDIYSNNIEAVKERYREINKNPELVKDFLLKASLLYQE